MADATDKKAEEPTYHVDRLIAEADDFVGERPWVVAGALAGSAKKNFTLDEVAEAIKTWQEAPIEIDNPVGANELALLDTKKGGRS